MNNPSTLLYTAIMQRLEQAVPAIRFISQDLGQLDFYDERPPVSWPCVLIDINDLQFENASRNVQIATATVTLRIAHTAYSDVSNLPNSQIRELGLKHLELEHRIGSALHGWQPPHESIGTLMRIAIATAKRDDNIRERVLSFSIAMQYNAELIAPTPIPLEFNA